MLPIFLENVVAWELCNFRLKQGEMLPMSLEVLAKKICRPLNLLDFVIKSWANAALFFNEEISAFQ